MKSVGERPKRIKNYNLIYLTKFNLSLICHKLPEVSLQNQLKPLIMEMARKRKKIRKNSLM